MEGVCIFVGGFLLGSVLTGMLLLPIYRSMRDKLETLENQLR